MPLRRPSMTFAACSLACSLAAGVALAPAFAEFSGGVETPFARQSTYPVYLNAPQGVDPAEETVAEISTVSPDGNTLIYTDAAGKRIGFVDISDAGAPKGTGSVSLAELGHADDQPTSVAVAGDYVLVVIDETGGDFANPKGRVDVLRLSDRERVSSIDLGGQPDSIAINPDGSIAAIAIENQRDEEREDVDGGLPQEPTGFVQTLDLSGDPASWTAEPIRFHDADGAPLDIVSQAGLDTPEDLEPEYMTINGKNQLAVTLQENDGVAIIDLNTKQVTDVWSAGSVDLQGVDNDDDGVIDPTGTIDGVVREPDAVAWVDDEHLATANEGDWKGGSRGWTVFDTAGNVTWDAGNSIEEIANTYGLHNEDRAGKKGPEIEGLATATMNGTRYAFVASERSNFVAVYDMSDPASPKFVKTLFSTNGPEGILPIESRGILAVSSEKDEADKGVRSAINVYQLGGSTPETPQPSIVSGTEDNGVAVPWTALGALSGDKSDAGTIYAASDSALDRGYIYTVDVTGEPATITERRTVTRDGASAEGLDIEGISAREDGSFWLASEGKTGDENRIYKTDANLSIVDEISLPPEISQHVGKWGLEGVDARINDQGQEELFVAIQRPLWKDPAADTREALEGDNTARIGRYNTETGEWTWFTYELSAASGDGDWMGLSEITVVDDTLVVIERDKLNGPDAKVKRVSQVKIPSAEDIAAAGDSPVALTPVTDVDLLPALRATRGWTQEKLEGFARAADGQLYAVTDNDGLDDATGETVFLRLGATEDVFPTAEEPEPGEEPTEQPSDEPTPEPTDGPVDNGGNEQQPGAPVTPEAPEPTSEPARPAEPAPSSKPGAPNAPGRDRDSAQPGKGGQVASPERHAAQNAPGEPAEQGTNQRRGWLPRTGVDGTGYIAVAVGALVLLAGGSYLVARVRR